MSIIDLDCSCGCDERPYGEIRRREIAGAADLQVAVLRERRSQRRREMFASVDALEKAGCVTEFEAERIPKRIKKAA